ncbi:type II secretion system protein GspM [Achromobacter sp. UMC71]|uniref:type II secretion system protein GspM n=1 Tax=Achromobacter sp. UMC71 TaxID=1862320 RepID=UPI0015FFEC4E|nr:type II secretion system protein GspM [Achromobacter sp. UMC71]MBB1627372.1 hypothetical protein [Achromobacter sp. UMC71]
MTLAPPPGSLGGSLAWRGRWRARWRGWHQQGAAAWSRLAAGERRLLALCALVVAGAGSWLAVIEPALTRIERSGEELRRLDAAARDLHALLRQAGPAPAARPAAVSVDALARWLDAAGLAGHYQVVPDESADGAWLITFHRAPAAPLAAWLLAGTAPLPLTLARVALLRQDEAEDASPGQAPGEGLAGSVRLRPILRPER